MSVTDRIRESTLNASFDAFTKSFVGNMSHVRAMTKLESCIWHMFHSKKNPDGSITIK